MRRAELEAMGIQLPVLATVALGALPGGPGWADRLARIGLDVIASGAAEDTAETWRAAAASAPHRPTKGRAEDPAALAGAGCRLIETAGSVPRGVYRLGPDEAVVPAVEGMDPAVEDLDDAARLVVKEARAGSPSALWVAATPGLDALDPEQVEAKLRVLVEVATQARLVLAKEQFEL